MRLLRPPRAHAEALERRRRVPVGDGERFSGYGVLGLPFVSGHVLAFRRVVSNTLGPPCTSVWHRDPDGRWTFYVDAEPGRSCPRYYGSAIDRVVVADVELAWTGPDALSIRVPERRLHWGMRVRASALSRSLDTLGRLLPARAWESRAVLSVLGDVASRTLGAGRLRLVGTLPNGQSYRLRPTAVWGVEGTAAVVEGCELGPAGPLDPPATLGGFPIPDRGLFVMAHGVYETFDPARHSARWAREGVVRAGR